jgi:hypothetical protein
LCDWGVPLADGMWNSSYRWSSGIRHRTLHKRDSQSADTGREVRQVVRVRCPIRGRQRDPWREEVLKPPQTEEVPLPLLLAAPPTAALGLGIVGLIIVIVIVVIIVTRVL